MSATPPDLARRFSDVTALTQAGPGEYTAEVDEACFVWDSSGQLVAQSTQPAAIRL
jgi:hypothetical protein